MYKNYFYLICIFIAYSNESIFADFSQYKPSNAEVEAATKPCLPLGDKQPINDKYACPTGNFGSANNQELSKERIECAIQMALSFSKIDDEATLWTKKLQNSREKNFNIWNEDIYKTLYSEEGFERKYQSVCHITNWTIGESQSMGCAKTTDFFPETSCLDLAKKKTKSLQNRGYILASKGTAKGYQNDKDAYIDAQKTKYSTLLDKWNAYMRSVGTAVQKFTAYTRNAVK